MTIPATRGYGLMEMMVIFTTRTGYRLHGSAYVIPKYISNTLLWDRLRVSGGAYGGSCDFDSNSGN